MVHLIQVMAEDPKKDILLASSLRVVRVPKWPEFSGDKIMASARANIPDFDRYIPDAWVRTETPAMPPDRDYLVQIIGTLEELWLKKSVTTATLMRQGQEKPDAIPDREDEYKISAEWMEQFIACPYKNCKLSEIFEMSLP